MCLSCLKIYEKTEPRWTSGKFRVQKKHQVYLICNHWCSELELNLYHHLELQKSYAERLLNL